MPERCLHAAMICCPFAFRALSPRRRGSVHRVLRRARAGAEEALRSRRWDVRQRRGVRPHNAAARGAYDGSERRPQVKAFLRSSAALCAGPVPASVVHAGGDQGQFGTAVQAGKIDANMSAICSRNALSYCAINGCVVHDRRDAESRRRLRPAHRAGYDVRNSEQLSLSPFWTASQTLPVAHCVPR